MKNIYLDNAATTQLRAEVISEMMTVLTHSFGNPSSSHSFGRTAKSILETSRKSIAQILGCTAQELIFTSNATEATNWILKNAVENLKITRIITSKIEHHATLYMVLELQKTKNITVDYVAVLPNGQLDINDLVVLLAKTDAPTLVSLMHVNNEIGTVLDIAKVGRICKQYNTLFHCDAVQSIGKERFNLNDIDVDFVVASAHKFHGPKGIGFAYIKKGLHMLPFVFGGEQEKGLRAGTEALHQVAGMAKALQLSNENFESEKKYILSLKNTASNNFRLILKVTK
jgi:cysteine desulfurase